MLAGGAEFTEPNPLTFPDASGDADLVDALFVNDPALPLTGGARSRRLIVFPGGAGRAGLVSGATQGDDRPVGGFVPAEADLGREVGAAAGRSVAEVAVAGLCEALADLFSAVRPLGGIFGQELADQPFQLPGGVRAQGAQGGGRLIEVLVDQVPGRAGEGPLPGDHLEEHAAEGVQVGAGLKVPDSASGAM